MQERRNCVFTGNQDYPQVNQYRVNVHLITSRLIHKLMLRDSEHPVVKNTRTCFPVKATIVVTCDTCPFKSHRFDKRVLQANTFFFSIINIQVNSIN